MMSKLLVNEVFWSLQGEGFFSGRPAVFIRLQGCSVGCHYCDTNYAQKCSPQEKYTQSQALFHKKPGTSSYFEVESTWLAEEVYKRTKPNILAVITGGEPCSQNIATLIKRLEHFGFQVQIETSGTEIICCSKKTWITLSPKAKPVLAENWQKASEIKLPVLSEEDLSRYESSLSQIPQEKICLQPVSCDPKATALCVKVCQQKNWRLSVQIHKYIGIL